MAPTTKYGSIPAATASGSGWSGDSWDRSFSQAKNGPWFDNYEGMARKTAIKRVLEYVPRAPMLAAAMRETSEGTYEIPDDIMELLRRQAKGEPEHEEQVPAQGQSEGTAAPSAA